jgi:hypothetical protein
MCGDDGSIANFGGIGGITTGIKNINEFENIDVKIYPNPTQELLFIEGVFQKTLVIQNILGEVIFSKINCSANEEFDTANLSNGIYIIFVNGNSFKFIRH